MNPIFPPYFPRVRFGRDLVAGIGLLALTALASVGAPSAVAAEPADASPAVPGVASDRPYALSDFQDGKLGPVCRFQHRAKGVNEPAVVKGFKDGKITLQVGKNLVPMELSPGDFAESDLLLLKSAIRPYQAKVNSVGCQHSVIINGHRTNVMDLRKQGLRKDSDVGIDELPQKSACLNLRGFHTTASFEVPVRVSIVWYGARPDHKRLVGGWWPGADADSTKACHVYVQSESHVLQGRECCFYSEPVRRCGIERDYCSGRFRKYVVLIYNELSGKIMYTNITNSEEIKAAEAEIAAATAEAARRNRNNNKPFNPGGN